jgi:predicted RNA-binding protein with PUA-like domain
VNHWLMKTEPEAFSIDDLAKKKRAPWDGVRNFQARNNMKAMAVGDLVLFYHSSVIPPGAVGVARVSRTAFPDHTAWDKKSDYYDPRSTPEKPLWMMVEVEFVEKFPRMVTLDEMKGDPKLDGMLVTRRGSRLSVQPVSAAHFARVAARAGAKTPA